MTFTKSDFYKAALTALNWAKWTKNSRFSYSEDAQEHLSGKTRAALAKPYSESLGLSENLPTSEGFAKYAEERKNSIDKFTTVKVGEETLAKKLTATNNTPTDVAEAMDAVKESIDNALKLTPDTSSYDPTSKKYGGARGKFVQELADLKQRIDTPDLDDPLDKLTNDLHKIKNRAMSSIKTQQTEDKNRLTELFDNPAFRKNLMTSLGSKGLTDENAIEDKINPIKTKMLQELETSHASELSTFEKSINDPINHMHNGLKARVAFLALIDPVQQNNKAITALAASSTGDSLGLAQGSATRSKSARYKNVDIKDLKEIITFTGKKITAQGEDAYTISLPNRILSTHYYRDSSHNLKSDIMLIPLALKARGYDTIQMNINHPNKEYARYLAQVAAEACIEAGFKPEDIKIMVNDEVYTDEKEPGQIKRKLFSDCGARYDAAMHQATINQKDWDAAAKDSKPEPTGQYKQRMADVTNEAATAENQERPDDQPEAPAAAH